ncbi:Mur ligase family protein [Helicobacter turcicus]|uniref:UDP-N-acetylmuramoyl-tripeptide--D-alanyl-D-alanine ligase n=1 Tax=Helicobacter turcicus TaxID=2867412 RepID=A0ABS7JMN6_9HELI|nr:UDP-N-acetylmuramoyl-tripeptide--D-alanyl-D-alanine ligase [Helicobacter turcicus]MBX7490641.1 UDP-N-acetylmuramoyl-tripeptide--D-alanyl-D-alanine ligase [Helicobacter turcicus]MBX7545451.1 UDP-N-acetylmuramoyl-tripeptide--D-alanyl-D-alanine ligase [Helicobacter turcicus]
MQDTDIFIIATRWIFLVALGYYAIVNLQWYHYKITRVLFKHHKQRWHLFYFALPILYFIFIPNSVYFYAGLCLYFLGLGIWIFNLSKKLILTSRILRFFGLYIVFIVFNELLLLGVNGYSPMIQCIYLLPLFISIFISSLIEKILLNRYKKLAQDKLENLPNLTIIAVTGSYGKTSLKNYLAQILQESFKVYSTPRSVNTLTGIIADINQNLSPLTDIYIVEAGARDVGNIKEIVDLIAPQIAVVGKIGEAHIEYFKSIENIYRTKYEILESKRLSVAYIYKDNIQPTNPPTKIINFPQDPSDVEATLQGTNFSLKVKGEKLNFQTRILGAFNVINISAAIAVGSDLGISNERLIKQAQKLEPINHRLSKIVVNGKIILDDSYNGNLDGMLEAIRLSSLHNGKKIIVTPGLIESSKEANIKLARAIDTVFDLAIITGELNANILRSNIYNAQKILLKDKTNIEHILKSTTSSGDLILFANDAPSYI